MLWMPLSSDQLHPQLQNDNTPAGRAMVRKILAECLPPSFGPHGYQVDGICRSMDVEDALATMATGTGKNRNFHFSYACHPSDLPRTKPCT